ncbi:MAG: reductive dehalogenase [Spirochaetota bacterium]
MPENLTRREFLRDLGLTAAGVTLAGAMGGAATKAFAETDNRKPSPPAKKYWWVKQQDGPTVEVDWKQMQRYKEWQTTRGSLAKYRKELFGEGFHERSLKQRAENAKTWELGKKPGYQTVDWAFQSAVGAARAPFKFMGEQKASTPQDRGVPRYEGTPAENSRIIRVALHHLGAASVGFVELDPNTNMKLIYDEMPQGDNRKIIFEDIDLGYEDKEKIVIPNKARYIIVFTSQMSTETMQRGPTLTGSNTTGLTYTRMWNTLAQLHEFIRGLGWNSYGTTAFNGLGIYPAMAVMAGLGELSRLNRLITPEYGPMVRETFLFTDLPLESTKPINFGVMEFCKRCLRCADMCPSKSLSFDREPTWEVRGAWNNPGHRAYFENSVTCRNYWDMVNSNCGICFIVCPYALDDEASIQKIWKITASITPLFDASVRKMHDTAFPAEFTQPMQSPESWWQNEEMPEYGINTMMGKKKL